MAILGCNFAAYAEIRLNDATGPVIFATLEGPISQSDVDTLRALIRMAGTERRVFLSLSSKGGEWTSALSLGRMLRQADGRVMVTSEGCYSACVMVLAGATHRVVFGPVGVHRPYVESAVKRSYSEAQSQFRKLDDATRRFLADMNVPSALFDAMVRVPPERMRVLTEQELAQFGLAESDPVAEELENADEARRYGITVQEYLARKARRDRVCDDLASYPPGLDRSSIGRPYMACRSAIMQGHSWPASSR